MNESKTKIDLRIPISLLVKIREIAKSRFNAKIHHISGEIEVTGTILKLIEIGIDNLDSYQDNIGIVPPTPIPLDFETFKDQKGTYLDEYIQEFLERFLDLNFKDYLNEFSPYPSPCLSENQIKALIKDEMGESLRIELDSLRNELEGKMRDDQPIPIPLVDGGTLPLFPNWESEPGEDEDQPIPPVKTEPNSSNGENDIKINMDIPTETNSSDEIDPPVKTEPNSTELDPIPPLTSQKLLNLIRKLKKELKIKNPEKFNQLDKRIKAINSLKGVKSSILADANSLNREERLEILSEFRAFITDSLLNSQG